MSSPPFSTTNDKVLSPGRNSVPASLAEAELIAIHDLAPNPRRGRRRNLDSIEQKRRAASSVPREATITALSTSRPAMLKVV